MKKDVTYAEAIAELQKLNAELENNQEADIDSIVEKIKRATKLINQCKKTLHNIDKEIERQLNGIDV
ncbi:MAG: exodeoxyribonuclease VII small subunit [Prevotellaceae bacterium]|jgi:exodeoxyribonuclease VII small subunit|nr:exodeoxyribonuclease VII small subunit [Prevotellaceae bacterium]